MQQLVLDILMAMLDITQTVKMLTHRVRVYITDHFWSLSIENTHCKRAVEQLNAENESFFVFFSFSFSNIYYKSHSKSMESIQKYLILPYSVIGF